MKINSSVDPYAHEYVECAAGFFVKANGYDYILTAGHCISEEYFGTHIWGSATAAGKGCGLGYPEAGEVSEKADAGVINAPGECGEDIGNIEADIVEWNVPGLENYPVKLPAQTAYEGLYQCHMGATSGNHCGTVEEANVAIYVKYLSETTIPVHHMDRTCALAEEGDSGGPVQYGNLEWTYGTGTVVGANSKNCSEGGHFSSDELSYALSAMGVTLQGRT